MGEVTRLYLFEDVQLDRDRIQLLSVDLGAHAARRVIVRALEDIAVRLTRIESAYEKGDLSDIRTGARRLIKIADQTGLTSVCETAEAVQSLCESDDSAALGAAIARLIRVGEMSLVTIWDVHDVSL